MNKIEIVLTASNMGPNATEEDFDAWAAYVCEHIDAALGVAVASVDQYALNSGTSRDTVTGGTEAQREAIRSWLSHDGWDAFCASGIARAS